MAETKSKEKIREPQEKPQPRINLVPITKEMQKAYLDYAMSVIVDRALPEVGDGLKPSQRRILVAMSDLGLASTGKYRKCAKIAGDTSGNYHPHGEQVIYPTLVRLAQDFNLRYPLIDGQGNFGSIDGDPPAAMRYTEARMAKFGELMLKDLEKQTVDFRPTYDGSRQEPVILPSLFPNLICNGTTGIAVGMATNIPPHNLNEVVDALTFMIDEIKIVKVGGSTGAGAAEQSQGSTRALARAGAPESGGRRPEPDQSPGFEIDSDVTVEDLTKFIKGPDFPTGGEIFDAKEIVQAYATGKGRVVMRAKTEIEEIKGGHHRLVVSETPYQVNKATLVARIAELIKDGKLTRIKDLRDESDRDGTRVVIELSKNARPQRILNLLYKHTELQKSFHANLVALVNGEPRVLTLKMLLEEYLRHRKKILVNRTIYLLQKAKHRAHILEGLKIALDHIDAVIETIKKSKDQETAKANLITKFKLTEIQAIAILDMQLRRLAALERQKVEDELKEVLAAIAGYEALLASPKRLMGEVKKEFLALKERFGDERRTKVHQQKAGEFAEEELIESQDVIISLTKTGYIKRIPINAYKRQGRGGKGVIGADLKDRDVVEEILVANTHDQILFFTNRGKVHPLKVWDIPEGSRRSKGMAAVNLIDLEAGEEVSSALTLSEGGGARFLIMATRHGTIKRTPIEELTNIRRTGIKAIKLKENDELCWVKPTDGQSEVMLVTARGKSIRFSEKDARPMGRAAAGVRGIGLKGGDKVVGIEIIDKFKIQSSKFKVLLVVTENGYGKLTKLEEYTKQKRGGTGILTARVTARTGSLIGSRLIANKEGDLLLTSEGGQVIRLPLKDISVMGRATQGVRVMKLGKDDRLAALTCIF